MIPTLITQRLKLRPFTLDDAPIFHKILIEPGVLQYFPTVDPPPLERVQGTIERINQHWADHGYGVWALELLASGELIGRCGLFYLSDTEETEIDYIITKAQWGKGFATEAAQRALRFGWEQTDKRAIVGIVHPENLASQHVLQKIGLKVTRADVYFGMDCFRYEILHCE